MIRGDIPWHRPRPVADERTAAAREQEAAFTRILHDRMSTDVAPGGSAFHLIPPVESPGPPTAVDEQHDELRQRRTGGAGEAFGHSYSALVVPTSLRIVSRTQPKETP